MPFLKRSKSQMVGNVSKANRPYEGQQEVQAQVQAPDAFVTALPALPSHDLVDLEAKKDRRRSRFERRSSIFGRAKSVDAPRKSSTTVDRPRTANRISEEEPDMPFRAGFLGVENETIAIQAGGDIYNFPTPSPRLPPQSAKHTMHSASPAAGSSGRATPIGIAIGSPSQTPPTWQRSYTAGHVNVPEHRPALVGRANTSAVPTMPDSTGVSGNMRKKKSGWKTLGGLFGRKAAKPSAVEPFYKVQAQQPTMSPAAQEFARRPPAAAGVARPLVDTPKASIEGAMRSPNSISSHHSRTPSINRGLARFEARAEADRKSFMPNIESKMARSPSRMGRENMPTAQGRPLEVIRDINTSEGPKEVTVARQTAARSAVGPPQSTTSGAPRTPKLDTDIPDGGMERYSVMFEKLLEPRRQSILERRQSKARRVQKSSLKKDLPATPEIEQAGIAVIREVPASNVPQRSVTSPHLNRVPSLSIRTGSKPAEKPAEQAQEAKRMDIYRPRPLTRSKTAPPGMSPVAPNFSRPKTATITSSDSDATPESPLYGENSLPPTPTSVATTMADHDGITVMLHDPMPTVRHQPSGTGTTWDLLTHSHNNQKAVDLSPASSDNSRAKKAQHISAAYPRIKNAEDLDRQIVQVSVARQVSVSRARRQVERAHESKQPLRPRVVDLTAAQVKNRKSTYVSIEGGEE